MTSKQVRSPPWNSRRLVHSKEMVWASRWSVALRAFYGQILSLTYSFFPLNFCRLVRALLLCLYELVLHALNFTCQRVCVVPTNIHVRFWIPHLQIHIIYTHQTIWMIHKITFFLDCLVWQQIGGLEQKWKQHYVCIQLANTVTDLNLEGFGHGGKFCHATVMFNSSASCFLCFFGTMIWQCWLNLSHPAFRICYHSKEKNVGSWKLDPLWQFLEGINLALPRKTRFHLGEVFTVHFIVKFRTCPFAPRLAKNSALTGGLHCWANNAIYSVDNTFQNTFFRFACHFGMKISK